VHSVPLPYYCTLVNFRRECAVHYVRLARVRRAYAVHVSATIAGHLLTVAAAGVVPRFIFSRLRCLVFIVPTGGGCTALVDRSGHRHPADDSSLLYAIAYWR